MILLFLLGSSPGGDEVVVFAFRVMPDLEDNGKITEQRRPAHQPIVRNCSGSSFFWSTQVRLVENLLRLSLADTVLSLHGMALRSIELEAHFRM
jgi:hypothetical protein